MIYLDNNATTRVTDEVVSAMTPWYRDFYGNPHAIHSLGRRAHEAIESARGEIALLLGCDPGEIVFTSCGTEANALVLRGLTDGAPQRRKVVTTAVEHPSVLSLLRKIERTGLIELAIVPVDEEGVLDLAALEREVDDRTLLVCVMLAQNETGVVHPVARVSAIAHRHGALVHVDAVQAAGKLPLSMRELDADFLSISGHKFHAPKGVGALAIRRGIALQPLWLGGGQELGLRSGTEPVPSIVGLGTAARLARETLPVRQVAGMRDRLESRVLASVPETSVNGATQERLDNTASIAFHGIAGDAVVRALDEAGICTSAGAACTSGIPEPTATMRAMGKPLHVAMGTVRFSLSRYTTAEEIDETVGTVSRVVARLREQTPG